MKKLSTVIAFAFLSISAFSQTGKEPRGSAVLLGTNYVFNGKSVLVCSTLEYNKIGTDTSYTIRFLNEKNDGNLPYDTLSFVNAADNLYDALHEFFLNRKGYKKSIKIGQNNVAVKTIIECNEKCIQISKPDSSQFVLTEKQLRKLFGR